MSVSMSVYMSLYVYVWSLCLCVCGLCTLERTNELECSSDLYQAVSELPPPNRDTLAYLITHLHRSVHTNAI